MNYLLKEDDGTLLDVHLTDGKLVFIEIIDSDDYEHSLTTMIYFKDFERLYNLLKEDFNG